MYTKEEVLSIITTQPNGNIEPQQFKKKYLELYQEIQSLSFPEEFKWTQKLYHFFHDDYELELGICPVCGKRCKFDRFSRGYCKHCSLTCSNLDKNVQAKHIETSRKHFGTDYPFQSQEVKDKIKKFFQDNYGVDNPMQLEESKQKLRDTCQERFGVDYYTQSSEFAKYHRKIVEYDGLTFDSSWEVEVYKFCKEHNIPCIYQPDIAIDYYHNGIKHVYHPDFLINDKIYEVNGDQFFDVNKMICPYDRCKDDLFEAKHKCILDNKVIILRKEQIDKIKQDINIFEVV